MKAIAVLAVLLASCGGSPEDCDQSLVAGTYLIEYQARTGAGCGELPSGLVVLNAQVAPARPNCVYSLNQFTPSECRHDSQFVCDSPPDDLRASYTTVVRMLDNNGDELSGILTVSASKISTGSFVCTGTYDIHYTRQ